MFRSLKVAVPAVVVTAVVPPRVPGPVALVAVIVKLDAPLLKEVRLLEYLSCKVATGGGLKATAINRSTGLFVVGT
jgi:hypothetical protein